MKLADLHLPNNLSFSTYDSIGQTFSPNRFWKSEFFVELDRQDQLELGRPELQFRVLCGEIIVFFFLNVPNPASFSFIFGLFKQTIEFLQQINVKKFHVHPIYGPAIRTYNLSNMSRLP